MTVEKARSSKGGEPDSVPAPDAVPVVQRLALSDGGAVARSTTVEIHVTHDGVDRWVYVGDGEEQMLEITEESARRLVAALTQSLGTSSPDSSTSGSIPR